jgi:hypothetical protein
MDGVGSKVCLGGKKANPTTSLDYGLFVSPISWREEQIGISNEEERQMKGIRILIAGMALLGFAGVATAEVHLNEIYASHIGTDDQEFIELFGDGSLDNLGIIIIEGDFGGTFGNVKRATDLTGNSMPGDGYFVVGDDAVANLDLSIGATNTIENGTETFVLIDFTGGALPAVGTDLDTDDDGDLDNPLTDIGTVLDIVGMYDGGIDDVTYGGAITLGPDGIFFPPGIFRGSKATGVGDYPEQWNFTQFLDFDDVQNGGPADNQQTRTPGTANVPEPATLAMLLIGGLAIRRRR